jgi:hypothetical protein
VRINHNPVRAYRNAVGSHTTLRFMDDLWVQRFVNAKTLKAVELERNVSLVCKCPTTAHPLCLRVQPTLHTLVSACSGQWGALSRWGLMWSSAPRPSPTSEVQRLRCTERGRRPGARGKAARLEPPRTDSTASQNLRNTALLAASRCFGCLVFASVATVLYPLGRASEC